MAIVRIGVDLVQVSRLASLLENREFVERVFQPSELEDARSEHLAGFFAAKEACFKALGLAPVWRKVAVARLPGGKPKLVLSPDLVPLGLVGLDLSISHDGDYAVASVVLLLEAEDGHDTGG